MAFSIVNHTILGFIIRNEWNVAISQEETWDHLAKPREPDLRELGNRPPVLAEHMAEGFAPWHLASEIVALGHPGDKVAAAQFTGEEAPPGSYFDSLVAAICGRWREDGKPKAIVRVPPMREGRRREVVAHLTQALAAENVRGLDATGTAEAVKQRFLTALKAEQPQTFAASTFDVMIGIQRVLDLSVFRGRGIAGG